MPTRECRCCTGFAVHLGRVNMHVYDTGRDLLDRGVIPLDDMLPETGLVKLMWALGQTKVPKKQDNSEN